MSNNKITDEKLEKYLEITGDALKKVRIADKIVVDFKKVADDFLDMAIRYYQDARHFKGKKDFVNAFACINYAHGWLDAGARLGVFDVGKDNRLFTVD